MKLNLEIIRTYLPENATLKSYSIETHKLIFRRPIFYEKGMTLTEGCLYVMRVKDLPAPASVPGIGIICVGERIPSAWFTSGIQMLWIPTEISPITILNQVNQLYDHFDDWDERLRDELEKETDFDIQRLLLLGTDMLENPINVVGNTLQSLFNVKFQPDSHGKIHYHIDDYPHDMDLNHLELVKQVCTLERALTTPYLSSIDLPDRQYYCNNLYPMGHFVGCISIGTIFRPFRESDFPLADHFFSYFQTAFFKYLRNNSQIQSSEETALQKLLRQESLTKDEKALFRLNPNESWILFKLKEKKGKNALPRDYMYRTLTTLIAQNLYASVFHKEIIGFIRLQENEETILDTFDTFIGRMDYYAGLSNRFRKLKHINDYLLQAHYMTEHYSQPPYTQNLFFFREHTLDYLLHTCTLEMSATSLIPGNLLYLLEHDQKKGTEYIKTLDVYLQNEMSITKTAEALFIHRTSLMKRLDKLIRLLDDDLHSPETRLTYRLCLAMLKNEGMKSFF